VKRVCVFCGSSPGSAVYTAAAAHLGELLVERGLEIVYGGARVGLMGAVAEAALAAGGHVIGVIPRALVDREIAHSGLSDLRIVESMHERKALMADLSQAFIALPGGMGTLEETCEILTWSQLGLHSKPCGLLDVAGYYQPLANFLDHAVEELFLRPEHRAMVLIDSDPERLLDRFASYEAPPAKKWIARDER
jgi:uncharacterized protein (TIGR00730 family)